MIRQSWWQRPLKGWTGKLCPSAEPLLGYSLLPSSSKILLYIFWRTETSSRQCQVWTKESKESWRCESQISSRAPWTAPGLSMPTLCSVPRAWFQVCLCWTWSHDLEAEFCSPRNFWAFFFFFFFPHNLHLDLERNPAIGPPTGWSNAWGWDMKPQSVFGFFRSKCEFRWSEEFSEQEMRCGWTCCKVAFHNVTPRQRNSHKSNFPIFGKGLYCYSSADFVCEFPCWPTFLITIFKAKNVKELAKTKPLIQLRKPFYFFRQTMW